MLNGKSRRLRASGSGAITFEFLIALPVLATTFAVLVQLIILLHARNIVDYAAFCAARSAAVWLTRGDPETLMGVPLEGGGSEAARRIHHSAALACLPLSPSLSGVAGPGVQPDDGALDDAGAAAIQGYALSRPLPALQVLGRSTSRLAMSSRAVTVELNTRVLMSGTQARIRLVEATVVYKQYLAIPIADQMLGRDDPPRGVPAGRGKYAEIRSTYVLPLEDEVAAPLAAGGQG